MIASEVAAAAASTEKQFISTRVTTLFVKWAHNSIDKHLKCIFSVIKLISCGEVFPNRIEDFEWVERELLWCSSLVCEMCVCRFSCEWHRKESSCQLILFGVNIIATFKFSLWSAAFACTAFRLCFHLIITYPRDKSPHPKSMWNILWPSIRKQQNHSEKIHLSKSEGATMRNFGN